MTGPERDVVPRAPRPASGPLRAFGHPVVGAIVAVAAVGALVARFAIRSPLWLDEALSVDIAKLPISRMAAALRHDGHPPLYYVLLHGWMRVVGTSDLAVRSLSGIISLATLPLAYRTGRRLGGPDLGWITVAALALSPYFLRYGSETRMYALVILLVFAGYLLIAETLDPDDPAGLSAPRAVAITAVTAALLWSHYWSMWLVAAVGLLLLGRVVLIRRRQSRWDRVGLLTIAAMALGAATFVLWLPVLAYQAAHTGTPWAKAFRPSAMIMSSIQEFTGGPYSEPQLLMYLAIALLVVGVLGTGSARRFIDLDVRTQPDARVPALVMVVTMAVASVVGIATRSAFSPRYAAIYFPLFILVVALGLSRMPWGVPRNVVMVGFTALSLVGLGLTFRLTRTQAGDIAAAIGASHAGSAIVVTCPDQLGPSVRRAVPTSTEVTTYPRFGDPRFVDWVDYAERNRRNDPQRFATELLQRAGDRPIFAVVNNGYLTLGNQCAELVAALGRERVPVLLRDADAARYFEAMSLYVFRPPAH